MRILQISTELVHSGAEKIVFDISCYLKDQGHEVVVACVKDVRGEVGDWLSKKGIEVYYIDLNYRKPFSFFRIFSFLRYIKRQNFDLIHAHQFHPNFIARLSRLLGGPKVISTVHLVDRRFRPWHFWFDSLTAFLCQKEICVSEAVRSFTAKKAPMIKNKLCVIYNGVDFSENKTEQFILPEKLNGKFIFGAVGRLYQQKGFIYLLKAFSILKQKNPNIGLVILGEGNLRRSFENYIIQNQLQNDVFLLGYSFNTSGFYQKINTLVIPSLFEGFGLVAVEAMGRALPVIASKVDSLPEIISDGETGFLCNPSDINSLESKMQEVLNNFEKAQLIGLAAKKSVMEKFTIKKMLDSHLHLYINEKKSL